MKRVVTACLTILCSAWIAATAHAADVDGLAVLTPQAVHDQLRHHTLTAFDANSEAHYKERHVPGATRIDFDNVTAKTMPADKNSPLVFYCMNTK